MQAGFHRAFGDVEDLCDLANRETVDETQRQRFPLDGRQGREEPADVIVSTARSGGQVLRPYVIVNREPTGLARRRDGRVFAIG